MVTITCYGGVDEIGGNMILLEKGDTRIMFDFGTRMGYESNYFAEFLDARTNTALSDRITIGALPKINGVYRQDLIRPNGTETLNSSKYSRILPPSSQFFKSPIVSFEEYTKKNGRQYLNALFLTHSHIDHCGAIGYLHQAIPLYCTEETKILLEATDEVSKEKTEAISSKLMKIKYVKETSIFPDSPKLEKGEELQRSVIILKDKDNKKFGDVSVSSFNVDHSVPGATSFLIETEGKKILYTGDIRFNGTNPMTISEYIKKIGPGIDILISEGTRIKSEKKISERDVKEKISKQIEKTKGLVFIEFNWKDLTRYETIRDAANSCGRTLVINAKLAYLLNKFGKYPPKENVKVFLKRKVSCLYSPSDYSNSKFEAGFNRSKGKDIDLEIYNNGVIAQEIKEHPEKYVLMFSFYDLGQIFDLTDDQGKIPNSFFIIAQCEPFSDDMEIDEERLINWLEMFGIGYTLGDTPLPEGCSNGKCEKLRKRLDRSHISGHASGPELKELIEKIHPKVIIPVHTEHFEEFEKIGCELKIRVIKPTCGIPIDIDQSLKNP